MSLILSGTDGLSDVDGSAATPAIRGTDANTGMFFPAADTIAFAEGGVEAMRLDASGNMGLGVTPSAWTGSVKAMQVGTTGALWATGGITFLTNNAYTDGTDKYLTTGVATRYYQSSGGHFWNIAPSGTAGNAITFTQAATLDASGNFMVGTTSTDAKLHVTNGASPASRLIVGGGGGAASTLYTVLSGGNNIQFETNGAERARIDSSGNLLVGGTGTTTTSGGIQIGLNASFPEIRIVTNGTTSRFGMEFCNTVNGAVGNITINSTSTSYNTSSDYRLKEDVQPMTGALARIANLKPCTYKWKADGSDGEGFIAHELAEVCPDAVTGEKDGTSIEQYEISPAVPATYDEDGNELTPAVEAVMGEREVPQYQGIDTSFLVATLTAAIQELKSEFDEYKASHP
jgi:hypothetical protein